MAQSKSSEARTGWLLISPPALVTLLLLAAPLATVLVYSVLTGSRGAVSLPFSAENYYNIFRSSDGNILDLIFSGEWGAIPAALTKAPYLLVAGRALFVALLVTLATVVLAYPIAYFVSFHVQPSKKALWLFLITIPFWTSYIIRVALWRTILGYDGIVDSSLMGLGLMDGQLNILSYGVTSIIITLAHAYAPFAVLPVFVSLEKVDRSLLEAGQDLGESKFRTFLRVTLPLSMPGVIAAVLIVFIPTVGDYVTPELIGGGKVPMISNFVEVELLKRRNFAMGSALAASAMIVVAVISLIFILMNRRFLGGRK
ncbi:ABC transporter permease [Pseudogemmobacter humi]|uniref:Spermidine/putrescine transport system permease protein PotB n=1 Tax=Pseudogemmobacter humi TaxID=2483812 RepID=A0A3P5XF60_9RHOB|nr:ABC transporter permease [Pseudogemmobacter humi]VDC33397.1 Spermidine/putrescine transport system permease protein PotB [Pseudogemmobacter humi]